MPFKSIIKGIGNDMLNGGKQLVGNFAGQLLNQIFANYNREQNFYWNEKAADAADNRQRAQYKDLYSPGAQLEQIKDAGLSPSLMLGNGAAAVGHGQAMGNMSMGASGVQGPMMSPIDLAHIENVKADTKLKESQAENTDKDTELKGQEIINLMGEDKNNRARFRLINAEADLAELQYSTDVQTAQATIASAYANAEKAANQARSAAVKADLDEATFEAAYQLAYANLDNVLTETALAKSEIGLNKAQIKEIAERIRNSQWETWQMEKEQNRKEAIFKFDQQKLKSEIERWSREMNIELTGMKLDMASDLIGYVTNLATCAMSNTPQLRTTEAYTNAQKNTSNAKQAKVKGKKR